MPGADEDAVVGLQLEVFCDVVDYDRFLQVAANFAEVLE